MLNAVLYDHAPVWVVAFPTLVLVNYIILSISPTGTFLLLVPLGFPLFFLSLGFLDSSKLNQLSEDLETGQVIYALPVIAFIYLFVAIVMATHEEQRLTIDTWASRFVYWDRFRHILALREFAHLNELEFIGPGGNVGHNVFVNGEFEGKELSISSYNRGMLIEIIFGNRDLLPIYLTKNDNLKFLGDDTRGFKIKNAEGFSQALYVKFTQDIGEDDIRVLINFLRTKRTFVENHSVIWTEGQSIFFYREKLLLMKDTSEDIEKLSKFLIKVITLMDENGLII